MKLLLPDRIEVAINSLGPLLGFPHLDSHIGVTGTGLIFSLQTLSTNNFNRQTDKMSGTSRVKKINRRIHISLVPLHSYFDRKYE